MAFLPFKNDIFISYAWLNDEVPPGGQKGWISEFVERLAYELSQRFERKGEIKIWRDKEELGDSTFFNDEIKQTIENSGIFIAFTSRGYLSDESYCPREISCFYEKVKTDSYSLKISNRSRLVNVLLQNIDPEEWLPEMEGTSGFRFHDATRKDQIGHLFQPDTEHYKKQMTKLVDELEMTLRTFKTVTELPARDEPKRESGFFKVFLGYTEGSLSAKRERLAKELQQSGVEVVTNIPPPFTATAHEKRVKDELENSGLAVHLFDDFGGNFIEGDANATYYQKQFDLAAAAGKRQLVCVPRTVEIDPETPHGVFIRGLENGNRAGASYRFLRQNQPTLMAKDVLEEIETILKQRNVSCHKQTSALLDIHEKDEDFAPELSKVFLKRKLKLWINPATDEPQKGMTEFDDLRTGISVLIIVLGHVTEDWVSQRLNFALQVAVSSLKFCGIYTPSIDGTGSPRPIDLSAFQIPRVNFPVAFCYTPQMLAGLLDKYV